MQEQLRRQQLPAHRRERDRAGGWERAKQRCFLTGFGLLGAEVMKREGEQLKSCRKAVRAIAGQCDAALGQPPRPGVCRGCAAGGHGLLQKGGPGRWACPGAGREGGMDRWVDGQMG